MMYNVIGCSLLIQLYKEAWWLLVVAWYNESVRLVIVKSCLLFSRGMIACLKSKYIGYKLSWLQRTTLSSSRLTMQHREIYIPLAIDNLHGYEVATTKAIVVSLLIS